MKAVVRAALAAAEAGGLVRRALVTADIERALRSTGAVDVVAVGKAAGPMLLAAVSGVTKMSRRRVMGVSAHPPQVLPAGVRWNTAAHPVPDDRSVAAARAVLDVAGAASDRDLLVPSVPEGELMASSVKDGTLQILEGFGHICLINKDLDLREHQREVLLPALAPAARAA